MIYSATRMRLLNRGVDPFQVVQRQIIFVIIAIVVMIAVMWIDYVQLRGNAEMFYAVTILLLILVFVAGAVKGGARLSFDVGPISIQPSELAKATSLLYLCGFLSEEDGNDLPYERFIQSLFIIGIPVFLVGIEPDLGSASVLVAAAMGVLLARRRRKNGPRQKVGAALPRPRLTRKGRRTKSKMRTMARLVLPHPRRASRAPSRK
jgi:cell division protein FtsW (lipid II flippase)